MNFSSKLFDNKLCIVYKKAEAWLLLHSNKPETLNQPEVFYCLFSKVFSFLFIFTLIKRKKRSKRCATKFTSNPHADQTSRRSSYLAFATKSPACSLCFPFPFPLAMIVGDDGNFSIIVVRGESNSTSSSSLV